jgi:hypothetical protein
MTFKRRNLVLGAGSGLLAVAALTAIIVGAKLPGGPPAVWPEHTITAPFILHLDLYAPRDFGRLPARGTAAGQFCGSIGTLGAPDHCWQFGADGTIPDLGDGTAWDLAKYGNPRVGITAGIPVDNGGVIDWTNEIAGGGTGATNYWRRTSTVLDAITKISITAVWSQPTYFLSGNSIITSSKWILASNGNRSVVFQMIGGTTKSMIATTATTGPAYRCCTVTGDTSGPNLGSIYCEGTDYTPSAHDFAGVGTLSGTVTLMAGYAGKGNVSRIRVDYGVASLADHKALCGTYGRPVVETHAAYADAYWTSQGSADYGARCFPTAAGKATCYDHTQPGATLVSGSMQWTSEPTRTNRIFYSGAPAIGTGWTGSVIADPGLVDGNMEGADTSAWTAVNSGTLSKETGTPHGGSKVLRVAYNTTAAPGAKQNILTPGHCYHVTGWARGDASSSPRVYLGATIPFIGTTSGTWQEVNVYGCADAANFTLSAVATVGHYSEFDDFAISEVAAVTAAESPSGLLDAASLVLGGGTMDVSGTGYASGVAVYPRLWAKCTTGTLTIAHQGGTGSWTINCATIAGAWTEIYSGHAAVTVGAAWQSTAGGAVTMRFSGADASVWAPTVTEVAGLSVIPTGDTAAGPTAGRFEISNINGAYWQYGDTIESTVTETSGTCVDLGPSVAITGQLGDECLGTIGEVKISGVATRVGATVIYLAGQSNAYGTADPLVNPLDVTHAPLPTYYDYWYEVARVAKFGLQVTYGTEPFFARTIADLYPHQPVVIAKRARGGLAMYAIWYYVWDAGRAAVMGDLEANWQYGLIVSDFTTILRGQTPKKIVLVWIQGESDSGNETCANDYAAGLDRLVTHLETDIGHQIQQIIVSRLNPTSQGNTYAAAVLAAQDGCPAASPGGASCIVINTDTFARDPLSPVHYNAAGLEQLGDTIGAAITP